ALPDPPSTPAPTKPPTCPSDQFNCATSETCIPASKVCDFKEDCMDGSDEKNCDEEDLLVSCSFKLEDKCGWFPENQATELDWVKYSGGKRIRSWQPPSVDVGHSGPYMFIVNHRNTEGRGHLVSKRLPAAGPYGRCFSFWYSMRHPNSGTLNLLTRSEDNSTELLWTRSGPQGRTWLEGYAVSFSNTYINFVLEAVLPGSTPAVIAIDDIDVRRGQCESTTVCDFEYDSCDWKLNDWEVSSGRSILEPSIDHTTETRSGSYVRLLKSNGRLVSPDIVVQPPSGSCLKFWYYLSGTDAEQLNVSRVTDFTRQEPIWGVLASQVPQKTWLQGSVNILGHAGHLAAALTGTTSGNPGTAVAVDDILTDMKSCAPAGNCNFEEDFCNWRNVGPKNHMRWYRNSGDTMTRGGPTSDHTLNTAEGIYLILDAQDLSEVREGALESELLSYGPDVCFRMFYRIASGRRNGASKNVIGESIDDIGCPSSFCLNGGHCNVWTEGGFPTCTCPDDVSGNRCEHVAGSRAEEQRYST
ncbi:hypothetical protein HPB47_012491, partial [Ixodes persulcatus]